MMSEFLEILFECVCGKFFPHFQWNGMREWGLMDYSLLIIVALKPETTGRELYWMSRELLLTLEHVSVPFAANCLFSWKLPT